MKSKIESSWLTIWVVAVIAIFIVVSFIQQKKTVEKFDRILQTSQVAVDNAWRVGVRHGVNAVGAAQKQGLKTLSQEQALQIAVQLRQQEILKLSQPDSTDGN